MKKKRGWFGDSAKHRENGRKGGNMTSMLHGYTFYQTIGRKGGKVSSRVYAKSG